MCTYAWVCICICVYICMGLYRYVSTDCVSVSENYGSTLHSFVGQVPEDATCNVTAERVYMYLVVGMMLAFCMMYYAIHDNHTVVFQALQHNMYNVVAAPHRPHVLAAAVVCATLTSFAVAICMLPPDILELDTNVPVYHHKHLPRSIVQMYLLSMCLNLFWLACLTIGSLQLVVPGAVYKFDYAYYWKGVPENSQLAHPKP